MISGKPCCRNATAWCRNHFDAMLWPMTMRIETFVGYVSAAGIMDF